MRTKEQCLKEGLELITARKEDWPKCVEIRFNDLYKGLDCDCFLDLVKAYKNGATEEEVNKLCEDQNHSGGSFSMVKSMCNSFCPEIVDWIK